MKICTGMVATLIVSLTACAEKNAPAPAAATRADARAPITVSGVSSGGYMAVQFHVAYSSIVSGAGSIAGGPWGCAEGDLGQALGPCIGGEGIEEGRLRERAREMAANGAIDPIENLSAARVFLFHGTADESVSGAVVSAAKRWYENIAADVRIEYVDTIDAAHGIPTDAYGAPCSEMATPFLNACNYDVAGELLRHLHGDLEGPSEPRGEIVQFRQGDAAGLAERGYAYVPPQCAANGACAVHVFFHGCAQSAEQVGTAVVENAGFNRWADGNDLIVLYPQVAPSAIAPQNPLGCWDWWGYTGTDYLAKTGVQLAVIEAMTQKLAAGTLFTPEAGN